MSYPIKNGQASVILRVKLLDSSSTVGAGLAGLTSASSGLIIGTIADNEATTTAYTVAGSTIETITTLGTYAAPTATKCRFKEVDATNHKGVYELQLADARYAVASAKSLVVSILGATNLAQVDYVVPLVSDDPYVAKPANYASFSIDASGRVDVIKVAGTTQTAGDIMADTNDIQTRLPAALTADGNMKSDTLRLGGTLQTGRDVGLSVLLSAGSGTGQLDFTSGVVKANATQWLGGTIPAVNVTGVPLVDTKYLLGTIYATPATAGIIDANVKNINNVAAATPGAAGGVFIAGTNAATTVTTALTTTFTGNLTGSVASVTAGVTLAAAAVQAIWDAATSALTTAGSIGKLLVDNINATISSRLATVGYTAPDNTSVAAIKVQTDKLTFTVANQIDANVLDWKSATAPAMTGDAFGVLSAAQAEPGQTVPAVNATPLTKIALLYKAWRNKHTQTATTYSLYADDTTTVDQKASVSDDGITFVRDEIGSGP